MTIKSAKRLMVSSMLLFVVTLMYVAGFFMANFDYLAQAEAQEFEYKKEYWPVRSIDAMKYSRDMARWKINDNSFNEIIYEQVKNIKETGATHIALGTPYDEEFLPFLRRWVKVAREYGLNVWFRGNMSGWEEWFGYPRISRNEHIMKTESFILDNPDLFEDDDIFSSCPECENGGPGDPRATGDTVGFRAFIVYEYLVAKASFAAIDKDVAANYFSMNGDVARLIMDKKTTDQLDNILVVDHYVPTTDQLASDIEELIELSGGQVVLGEFGFPIPDIHGARTIDEQTVWVREALEKLSEIPDLVGVNYWTNAGGSTGLWQEDGRAKPVVELITSYYSPQSFSGYVYDDLERPLPGAIIEVGGFTVSTDERGFFSTILTGGTSNKATVKAEGFKETEVDLLMENNIFLTYTHERWPYQMARMFSSRVDKLHDVFVKIRN